MTVLASSHLGSDNLLGCNSAEGVVVLFRELGYPTELLGAAYLRTEAEDILKEAWELSKVEDGRLRVYLLELERLNANVLRAVAARIQTRYPQVHLLLVATADWRRLAFINVRPVFSDSGKVTVKTYRVTIDRQNPTRPDLDLVNKLRCASDKADEVFVSHCEAFNVDKVTEQFYKEYGALFRRFLAALEPQEAAVTQSVQRASHRQETLHAFTVRLMGRVMFLYFLQKKGWLAGDTRFLEQRYEECRNEGRLYYNEVLEPLFFRYLATREGQESPWGRIPYLNGGLFVREYGEDLILSVPNELFDTDRDRGPNERGLLGFFASYNFTVDEDTPLDVQVALDPELLGKVFENLLEEHRRGRTGTFYTPRPIVNFMVRESITRHLEEVTASSVSRQRLLALLDDERWEEAALNKEEARDLEAKAMAVRILDPAVGTGAFLVSALQHLVQIVRACRHRLGEDVHPGTTAMADLKRRIIRDCLFGVDIEPEAIELAQLRLWLSLVLDLDPREDPDPLPNLDFELMVGNSLIDSVEGVNLAPAHRALGENLRLELGEADVKLKDIAELKQRYFATSDLPLDQREMQRQRIRAEEMATIRDYWNERAAECMRQADALGKQALEKGGLSKRQQDELKRQVRRGEIYQRAADAVAAGDYTTRPFVYELEFADIFQQRGGFDIVIANPPYVSVQGSSKLPYREELGRRYSERVNGKDKGWVDDLYVHFVFRAFELARPGGVVCFITADTYFTIQSKRRMRQLLHTRDLRVIAPCDPFRATVDAAVFLAINRPQLQEPECEFDQMRYVPDEDFDRLTDEPDWQGGAAVTVNDSTYTVREWLDGKLRRYRFDPRLWLGTQRMAIWEPSQRNAVLYERLILPAEPLLREWWEMIETSEKYRKHREEIEAYLKSLKPGDITLLGLVADGGQGLATANNGRFLAYREDTPQGQDILKKRLDHIQRWQSHPTYGQLWTDCLAEAGADHCRAIDLLRQRVGDDKKLGLGKGELYKTLRPEQCVASEELERLSEEQLDELRYKGSADVVKHWVPFRKGDRQGRRWWAEEPLYIDWSRESVQWLQDNAHKRIPNSPRWQNLHLFFRSGVAWNPIGRDVALKGRLVPPCVISHKALVLLPSSDAVDREYLLALLNAPVVSYISKEFINSTNYEMNDIRQLPVVMPDVSQASRLYSEVSRLVNEACAGHEEQLGSVPPLVADILGVKEFQPFEVTH